MRLLQHSAREVSFTSCQNVKCLHITASRRHVIMSLLINTIDTNNVLQVSVNGLISFGSGNNAYIPHQTPPGLTGIAVYFSDVSPVCGDGRVTGNVYYRSSTGECDVYRWR